jgi:hypothetical protein
MGIVFPNEAVARRWEGALQARLRRAPLERFLRARGIVPVSAGVAQDTDNVVRATVSMVESGLAMYFRDREDGLAPPQQSILGHVTCLVSRALTRLILRPDVWRIVALVSTARLLAPWIGLNAAALASTTSTRHFEQEFSEEAASLDEISHGTLRAVEQDSGGAMAEVSANIARRLSLERTEYSTRCRKLPSKRILNAL